MQPSSPDRRNPWGKTKKGIWEGAWSDGSKEWTTEVQQELGHQFGSDSVFWISYEDLLRKYQHFDRTRLFRDPDWRCCQRWIGVEVPWKPQYNEKFHIKLTRESPLVLVLSQLDNRYFKGLTGQYSFRLQFRLHEQDRPDPEDYIVRSHGNYLMDRSVSIELPAMLPGNYSVFISVIGERDTEASSIEDVVKRECKKRAENEKLAQVGYAYDLAHSKAAAHLDALKRLRKRSDQKKASEARAKERHRLWERRHLNRDVTKKQGRKNNEKLLARQAKREEKRRLEEGLKPVDHAVQTEEPTKEKSEEEKKVDEKSQEEISKVEEEKKEEGDTENTATEEKKEDTVQSADKPAEEKPDADSPAKDGDDNANGKSDTTPDEPKEEPKEEPKDVPKEETPAEKPADEAVVDDDDGSTPDGTPILTPSDSPLGSPAVEKTEEELAKDSQGQSADKPEDQPSEAKKEDASEEKKDVPEERKAESKKVDSEQEKAQSEGKKTDETPANETAGKPEEKSEDGAEDKTAEAASSTTPKDTPKSEASSTATSSKDGQKVPVPPATSTKDVSGGPPPPPTAKPTPPPPPKPVSGSKKTPNMYVTSDGESSASPIDEWELLYSSDDMTRKPRSGAAPAPGAALASKYAAYESDDDSKNPDPWNAICVVGLRVYSKDEDLELRVVMEGGELEEGGMGEKGGVDLDNAQANAGGARRSKRGEQHHDEAYEGDSEEGKGKGEEDEDEDDGKANYPVIVQKGKGEDEYESAKEPPMDY